jgi:hypothetical protein
MRPLLFVLAIVPTVALAQSNRTQPRTEPKTELVFEDGDLIDGTTQTPDVELVTKAGRPRHPSLLKVRTDFRKQVLESVSQL